MKYLVKLLSVLLLVFLGLIAATTVVDEVWVSVYMPPSMGPTPTPFQPVPNTPTPVPTILSLGSSLKDVGRNIYETRGVRFDQNDRVNILIKHPSGVVFDVRVRLKSGIGLQCDAGKNEVCADAVIDAILLQIHSASYRGVKEPIEEVRRDIEGYRIWMSGGEYHYSAKYSLGKIRRNLESYVGSEVDVVFEGGDVAEYTVLGAVRFPPSLVAGLGDIHDVLKSARISDQRVAGYLGKEPLVLVYFCGWKLEGEEPVEESLELAWSRYLLVLTPKY